MSVQKTKELKREFLPVGQLEVNPDNPNEMDDRTFNMLFDNVERMGITDPILVRPHPTKKGMYRIVGGAHRFEVAKVQGYEEVPVTIVTDPNFTVDEEAFQIVRHNIIGGKMSPAKFMNLVNKLEGQYGDMALAEMFGFVDEEEFKKLVKSTAAGLPKELQQKFKDGAKDLKTLDDLAKLLNQLYATHGDTLPHGYMFLDFGGKESVWVQMPKSDLKHFTVLADKIREDGKTIDHVFHKLFARFAKAKADDPLVAELHAIIAEAPTVKVKADAAHATLDYLTD